MTRRLPSGDDARSFPHRDGSGCFPLWWQVYPVWAKSITIRWRNIPGVGPTLRRRSVSLISTGDILHTRGVQPMLVWCRRRWTNIKPALGAPHRGCRDVASSRLSWSQDHARNRYGKHLSYNLEAVALHVGPADCDVSWQTSVCDVSRRRRRRRRRLGGGVVSSRRGRIITASLSHTHAGQQRHHSDDTRHLGNVFKKIKPELVQFLVFSRYN